MSLITEIIAKKGVCLVVIITKTAFTGSDLNDLGFTDGSLTRFSNLKEWKNLYNNMSIFVVMVSIAFIFPPLKDDQNGLIEPTLRVDFKSTSHGRFTHFNLSAYSYRKTVENGKR